MNENSQGTVTEEESTETQCMEEIKMCANQVRTCTIKDALPLVSRLINERIESHSYMRNIFDVILTTDIDIKEHVTFDLPDELDSPVWILPGMGYMSQEYLDLVAEKILFMTFTVQASKSWPMRYDAENRDDLIKKALDITAKTLAKFETEAGWRLIIPPATSSWDGGGILPPRPANIYQMADADGASGYFSKELVNRMIVGANRQGKRLKEIWLSPEDMADIREWTEVDIDPEVRQRIFRDAGLGALWGIQLRCIDGLGVRGAYNIHDRTSGYGPFKGNAENKFNDYQITQGNVLDVNGNLVTAGETQIYGFCEDIKDSLKLVTTPYEAYFDRTLVRRQQTGIFGWKQMAMGCLEPRSIIMGVINRGVINRGVINSPTIHEEKIQEMLRPALPSLYADVCNVILSLLGLKK